MHASSRTCPHGVPRPLRDSRRQRFRHQAGQRQRHRLGQRQQPAHAGDLPHGHSGVAAKICSPRTSRGCPPGTRSGSTRPATRPARCDYDLMVAMNAQTYERDVRRGARRAAICSTIPPGRSIADLSRDDVTFLGVPLAQMCNENFRDPRERILMKNIAYAGALVALLDIDMDRRRGAAGREVRRQEGAARIEPASAHARATNTRSEHSTVRCRSISRRWTPTTTRS